MITLMFTVYFAVIIILDLTWGLILPGWVVLAMAISYLVIVDAEYDVVKRGWRWVNKFSSRRS